MNITITVATSRIGRQLAIDFHREGNEAWPLGKNDQDLGDLRAIGINTGRLDLMDSKASDYTCRGLAKKNGEIHFLKRFSFFFMLLSLLPVLPCTLIGQKMVRK